MSEPLERPVDTPAVETPDTGASPDPVLEHATTRLERIVEPRTVPAAETAAPPAAAPPPAAPAAPAGPVPIVRPITPAAQAKWEERRRAQAEKADKAATQRLLSTLQERIDAMTPAEPAAEAGGEGDDLEPDFDSQPREWIIWRDQKRDKEMLAQLDPLLSMVRKQGESRQQFEQRQVQQAHEDQAFEGVISELRDSHAIYMEEGGEDATDYPQRLAWYAGRPGNAATGEAGFDGVIARGLIQAQVPPEKARAINNAIVFGLAQFASDNGINAAWLVDQVIKEQINDMRHVAQQQPQRPQIAAGAREVASMRRTAEGAATVAGTLSQAATRRRPASDPVGAALRNPAAGIDDVLAMMKKTHGASRQGMNKAMRKLREFAEESKGGN